MTALEWVALSIPAVLLAWMAIAELLLRRKRHRQVDPILEPLSPRALAGLIERERENQ